jgi:hypothetical protein
MLKGSVGAESFSHPRRLAHPGHQKIAVVQDPLRAALTILHRYRSDAAVALIKETQFESIELQIDERLAIFVDVSKRSA